MKIQPLSDRVILKPIKGDEVTKAGIIIPDTAEKEKPEQGEVVAVGPGKMQENGQRTPVSVKEGNKVLFKKYSPDEVKVDDQEFLVVEEGDIIAVIE
ncbi:MAG: co-chaperone GroES [Patescibacteria group bacterium]